MGGGWGALLKRPWIFVGRHSGRFSEWRPELHDPEALNTKSATCKETLCSELGEAERPKTSPPSPAPSLHPISTKHLRFASRGMSDRRGDLSKSNASRAIVIPSGKWEYAMCFVTQELWRLK